MIAPDLITLTTPNPFCLVIEPNADLHLVIQYALLKEAPQMKVVYAASSPEALEWLELAQDELLDMVLLMGEGPSALVDWSLLEAIKQRWPYLPVLVFGGPSMSMTDVKQAYQLGANSLLTKPASLEEWESLIQVVVTFWFWAARLPSHFYPFR